VDDQEYCAFRQLWTPRLRLRRLSSTATSQGEFGSRSHVSKNSVEILEEIAPSALTQVKMLRGSVAIPDAKKDRSCDESSHGHRNGAHREIALHQCPTVALRHSLNKPDPMERLMPPHCDSMDGPVVTAARRALAAKDASLILPYVHESGAAEVQAAFDKVLSAREVDPAAREVADLYFFETVVRVHRAGEGASYTGLKPAGLDVGPVIPVAEKAIASGSPDDLIGVLTDTLKHEVRHRFAHMQHLRDYPPGDVARARAYVEAMLGLQVYSHKLYEAMKAQPHEGAHEHQHG
jgi:hypothetical protein